jgi:hypothetical protein
MKDVQKGAIIYFVEKGTTKRVLTMGKIESKEHQILSLLATSLQDFWKPYENIKAWTHEHEAEYNHLYENFIYQLEFFEMQNSAYYKSIAELSFVAIKDELELYNKFKKSLCDFYIEILSRLGFCDDAFVISSPKPSVEIYSKIFNTSEESKATFEDEEVKVQKSEDAIDRLLKNEQIRKHSNIQKEEEEEKKQEPVKPQVSAPVEVVIVPKEESKKKSQPPKKEKKPAVKKEEVKPQKVIKQEIIVEPTMEHDIGLEDIIGSLKEGTTGKGKKVVKKQKKKSVKKTEPTKKVEERTATGSEVITPAKQEAKEHEKTKPRRRASSIENLKIDEVDEEPPVKLYELNEISGQFDHIADQYKEILQDFYYQLDKEFDASMWFLASSQYPLDEEIKYTGYLINDPKAHSKLHTIPIEHTKLSSKHRVFRSYSPFGLRQRRNCLTFKNKVSGDSIDFN